MPFISPGQFRKCKDHSDESASMISSRQQNLLAHQRHPDSYRKIETYKNRPNLPRGSKSSPSDQTLLALACTAARRVTSLARCARLAPPGGRLSRDRERSPSHEGSWLRPTDV